MMEIISPNIATKRDLYFRHLFPFFDFKSLEDGSYLPKIKEGRERFLDEMQNFDIFADRPDHKGLLRATVLSTVKMSNGSRALPLGPDTRHTIILYCGGGGFLANLQLIQENFLKIWARKTNITLIQMHYSLSPESQYPQQTNDVFNIYMQVVLYYKLVQGISDLRVILMGDSAGACISLSLMNMLAKVDTELPVELFSFYPPVDFRPNRFTPSLLYSMEDKLIYFTVARTCFNAYVPKTADHARDWLLSPVLAPDEVLRKYPKTYIYCGERDALRDDCVRLGYRIHKLNKDGSTLFEIEGIYHGFLGFQLPLGLGVDEVVEYMKDQIQERLLEAIAPVA